MTLIYVWPDVLIFCLTWCINLMWEVRLKYRISAPMYPCVPGVYVCVSTRGLLRVGDGGLYTYIFFSLCPSFLTGLIHAMPTVSSWGNGECSFRILSQRKSALIESTPGVEDAFRICLKRRTRFWIRFQVENTLFRSEAQNASLESVWSG